MKLLFLGTGTSIGVPVIGCNCATCTSTDPCDARLRTSALLMFDDGINVLIDCGPDFRQQILAAGSPELEALVLTHSHYDHTGGIDDLRPYCKGNRHFPTYCTADVDADLRVRNPWSFAEKLYPGVPTFDIRDIRPLEPFDIAGHTLMPLPVMHAALPIVGYMTEGLAYITDCKTMPDETLRAITGVDTLVINALRHKEHQSHICLAQALDIIRRAHPRIAYLIHMSHDIGPEASVTLPPDVHFAHDGLLIEINQQS